MAVTDARKPSPFRARGGGDRRAFQLGQTWLRDATFEFYWPTRSGGQLGHLAIRTAAFSSYQSSPIYRLKLKAHFPLIAVAFSRNIRRCLLTGIVLAVLQT